MFATFKGRCLLIAVTVVPGCFGAAYTNLIATSDGKTVYFSAPASLVNQASYVAKLKDDSTIAVTRSTAGLLDLNGSGTIVATGSYGLKWCSGGHSGCDLAPRCRSYGSVFGPGSSVSLDSLPRTTHLSRSGAFVAFSDLEACPPPVAPPSVPSGIYSTNPSQRLADAVPAYPNRPHRRAITDGGRMLAFTPALLFWQGASGIQWLHASAPAVDATSDASGDNVAYVATNGELHWMSDANNGGVDEDLGFVGWNPVLSDGGKALVFIDPTSGLPQLYLRESGMTVQLGQERFAEFVLGGDAAVFAVTESGRLVRIQTQLADGGAPVVEEWLPAMPEVAAVVPEPNNPNYGLCPLPCYGPVERILQLSPGMIVTFTGLRFDAPAGVTLRLVPGVTVDDRFYSGGDPIPIEFHVVSPTAAWAQIPSSANMPSGLVEWVLRDGQPTAPTQVYGQVYSAFFYCLPPVHDDGVRRVTAADPAVAGEVISYYISGLRGVEDVADGLPNPTNHDVAIANPPALLEPDVFEVRFFGLAPGLIGYQRADLAVRGVPRQTDLFQGYGQQCKAPSVAK